MKQIGNKESDMECTLNVNWWMHEAGFVLAHI